MHIGIIGGGQLARMMILAGYPLGHTFTVLDPSEDACGAVVANHHILGGYDSEPHLKELARNCDVVTFDFENVPADALTLLEHSVTTYPPRVALAMSQDRLIEKTKFNDKGIDTAPFHPVNTLDDLQEAISKIGLPGILKTRRLGYDGKGQAVIKTHADIEPAFKAMQGQDALFEGFVNFECEVSLLSVRDAQGNVVFYPIAQNEHVDGILHISQVPAPITCSHPKLQQKAETLAMPLLKELDYVGVLAIEFFVVNGELVANELAPRVHNSGHWSIEGAVCSQFENHIRAISGLPLGSTEVSHPIAMVNCIGDMPPANQVLKLKNTHLHDYDKMAKSKRKVGHITVTAKNTQELNQHIQSVVNLF